MLKQRLSQKLSQKLSPQQIQLMKLIKLPTQALEERIKEELEENPALEEGEEGYEEEALLSNEHDEGDSQVIEAEDINIDEYLSDDEIPEYRLQANNYSPDDEDARVPVSGGQTFYENVLDQLRMRRLTEEEFQLSEYLIGSMEEDGYIRRNLVSIVDDLAFSANIFTDEESLEKALKVVQSLDPAGIGARSLQECLLLQMQRRESNYCNDVTSKILSKYFDEFSKRHFEKIMERLQLNQEDMKEVISIITQLNPKPGNSITSQGKHISQAITPDFVISIKEGELELSLNARNVPELRISGDYKVMLETYKSQKEHSKQQNEAVMFVKQKLDSARWFVDAIRQRQQTLLIVMGAIMEKQSEYFLTGDERDIKPMILKDIAEVTELDISTISRVASNKYVQTPYGTFLIKEIFSESMTNEQGEEVSTREIKNILEELIDNEDKSKPVPDDQLALLLKERGYPIARRTIAKYRDQLNIPTARLRKEL